MKQKLTASVISKLSCPNNKAQIKFFDTEVTGLAVRITRNGAKTFIFERRPKGTSVARQEKIGRCSDFSIEQARSIARQKAVDFEDPDYLQKVFETKTRLTFKDAYEQYVSVRMSALAQTTREKQIGLFQREVLPTMADIPLESFVRKHLSSITLPIQQSGRQGTASDVWKSVSAFLTWCVKQGYLSINPVLGATPEFQVAKRERKLTLDELASVWRAAEALTPVRCSAVRLLLLLPFRKTEFTRSVWDEFDGEMMNIPSERTKSKRAISLYLTDFAKKQLPLRRNDSNLIFTTNGQVPTRLDDKLLKRLIKLADVEPFGWHDNRRTFSTNLNDLAGADYLAIEACLNHQVEAQRGVSGVYNRATYAERMQAVLQQWSDKVEAAVD
ncbi:tyrosine-type recombinase/integrase [Candidatus Puniceispirillum marinum]|uniref:Phage integrase family protein n=1 Tax=Puniceispirillum marinum (strain IMCC1322) TaxID=488538 RepID=D5BPD6_PUNMI|nr:site-specific integrase [Candidatus Puniceispirillum marinum]ADE38418.1 phage integrase family protein [Candidatus Puniceispirillum marinum IMCC1322]